MSTRILIPSPTLIPIALWVEILSPQDRPDAVLKKCEEYHEWGVPFCWVIDPVEIRAWIYEAGKEAVPVSAGESLRAGDVEVDLQSRG